MRDIVTTKFHGRFEPDVERQRFAGVRLKTVFRHLKNFDGNVFFFFFPLKQQSGRASHRKTFMPPNGDGLSPFREFRQDGSILGKIVDRVQQNLFSGTQISERIGADIEEIVDQVRREYRIIGGVEAPVGKLDIRYGGFEA